MSNYKSKYSGAQIDTLLSIVPELSNSATKMNEEIQNINTDMSDIHSNVNNKVDKEAGKGLSTEDYTTEEKNLLSELDEQVDGLSKAVSKNESDIANLSGRVDTNTGDIATNAFAIEANTKSIAQNLQSIADIEDRAIVCTASGENIHLEDSSNSKLKGMRVFGKTIQDMFCLNQGTSTITINGCTYTLVDGKTEMVVTGTSTRSFSTPLSKLTLAAGTYSISFSGATYGSVYMFISNASNGQTILGGIYSTSTLTITETTDVMINMVILAEKSFDNAVIKVSLTGNLSPYAPHPFISAGDSGIISVNVKNESDFENQMLSISTPTALFGVPVAKDGNYIDSAGKQWICDEIDLNRGVHIKRLALSTVAFSHFGTHSDGRVYGVMYAPLKIEKSDAGALCEKAEFVSAKITADCFYENAKNVVFSGDESDTNETLKAKFEGCGIIYILANAVETPLTSEQIAAYKALHTNKTITDIYNSENAYMQVEYVADTKSYVDNKIEKAVAQLSAAIITE